MSPSSAQAPHLEPAPAWSAFHVTWFTGSNVCFDSYSHPDGEAIIYACC